MNIEKVILKNLCQNEDYSRKVLPFLETEYFTFQSQPLFSEIKNFWDKYQSKPTPEAIAIQLEKRKDISDDDYKNIIEDLNTFDDPEKATLQWLLDTTESFCKDSALDKALAQSVHIASGKNKKLSKTSIPEILSKALGVCFDSHVGHDYVANAEERFASYQHKAKKYPTHLAILNTALKGGFEEKTINVISALTGVGKTALMIDLAAHYTMSGHNVLYITLEMAKEKIGQRIDANLLNISLDDIEEVPTKILTDKLDRIKDKIVGRLIIEEYPISSAHTGHFRYLLRELKQKQNFVPKIIIVDYLNICASANFKKGGTNSYEYIKSIAEELRSLAQEQSVVMITATQLNRDAVGGNDPDESNVSESFGGPMTFDWFCALIKTDELAKLGHVCLKQLKSRYNNKDRMPKMILGFDDTKMKFFELSSNTTQNSQSQNTNTQKTTQSLLPSNKKILTKNTTQQKQNNKFSKLKIS